MRWSWKRPSVPEKYQPWLKENQWWIQLAALFTTVLIIAIAFKRGKWLDWVGFSKKTVWDWLGLLGVPLTLAILGYILQQQERNRAEILAREQRGRDERIAKEQREIAANEVKEETLQIYFDRLSTLLIDKNILAIARKLHSSTDKSQGDDQLKTTITPEDRELFDSAIDVIRARTLSILRRFEDDAKQKNNVISFLLEAEIIIKTKLDLSGANLSGAKFFRANLNRTFLSGADLSQAELFDANLSGANLGMANLSRTLLSGADLSKANLYSANLSEAYLGMANLSEARLDLANLSEADLSNANLSRASLIGVNLSKANLSNADLSGARLIGVNLSKANLGLANLSEADLREADLREAEWDDKTQWPDPAEVAKALNIPETLKQQLGLTDTPLTPDS